MLRVNLISSLLFAIVLCPFAASAKSTLLAPLASTEDCSAEWSRSSASRSCDARVFGRPGLTCRVEASCARPTGGRVENKYNLDYNQVRNLVNCNGLLKVGGC